MDFDYFMDTPTLSSSHGKFIVIDGTDGAGKGTQCKLLIERLQKEGYPVMSADFPQYGQKSAGLVEEYLAGKYGELNAYAASIFYAVDRFDASFKIRQWLEEGKVVISNRYVTANAGHQGGKIDSADERKKYFDWLHELEYGTFNIPKPDLNIILHVTAELAQQLVDQKDAQQRNYVAGAKRDLHEADLGHLKRAEQTYLEITRTFPNTDLIECMENDTMLSIEAVHAQIWHKVTSLLGDSSNFRTK